MWNSCTPRHLLRSFFGPIMKMSPGFPWIIWFAGLNLPPLVAQLDTIHLMKLTLIKFLDIFKLATLFFIHAFCTFNNYIIWLWFYPVLKIQIEFIVLLFSTAMSSFVKTDFVKSWKKSNSHYLLAILYLASIFIQLTSIYCALFIVFLIICSEFVDAFVTWFQTKGKIFTLKTSLFTREVQVWNSSVCYYWHYYFFEVYKILAWRQINFKLKKNTLYGPFLWVWFNCLKATATLRRQFTLYH